MTETPGPDPDQASPRASRSGRSWGRWVIALMLLAVAIAVVVDTLAARSDLLAAEQKLENGERALRELDLDTAVGELIDAAELTSSADARLSRPHVRLASWTPFLGNSLETGAAIAQAGADLAEALATVARTVDELPGGVDAIQPQNGRIPVDVHAQLAPLVADASMAVDRAVETIARSPDSWLLGEVATARSELLPRLVDLRPLLDDIATLAEVLPDFLGHAEPRTYFLAVANPAELRAVGGYIGAYSLVTFDNGGLAIDGFAPIWTLGGASDARLDPPDSTWLARYGGQGGLRSWENLNLSPHFPSVATAIERLWAATEDEAIHGTILVDPYAFESLVRLTGPVTVPETGVTLRPATLVDYVTNGSFADLANPTDRKEIIGEVAAASLERFLDGPGDMSARTLRTFTDMVQARSVMLHATDPAEQAAFEQLDIAGSLDPPAGDFVHVSLNSATASKVDYWLDQHHRHDVTLLSDGRAHVVFDLELVNNAPEDGQPARTIGPNAEGLEAGGNRLWVNVHCTRRCTFTSIPDETAAGPSEIGRDRGNAVASTWVEIPAGERRTLRFEWEVEEAWSEQPDGSWGYLFTQRQQVSVRGRTLSGSLTAPDGWAVTDTLGEAETTALGASWTDSGRFDVRLGLLLTPPD